MQFLQQWLFAWTVSFVTMLPVVIFVAPLFQRCVLALTMPAAGGGLPRVRR
jgi:Protein of unknown function (DUF2798)